jgi:hypothetical protein
VDVLADAQQHRQASRLTFLRCSGISSPGKGRPRMASRPAVESQSGKHAPEVGRLSPPGAPCLPMLWQQEKLRSLASARKAHCTGCRCRDVVMQVHVEQRIQARGHAFCTIRVASIGDRGSVERWRGASSTCCRPAGGEKSGTPPAVGQGMAFILSMNCSTGRLAASSKVFT